MGGRGRTTSWFSHGPATLWTSEAYSEWPLCPCRMLPVPLRNALRICTCEHPRLLYTFGREIQMQFGGSQGQLTKRRTEGPTESPAEGLAEQSPVIWTLYDKYYVVFGRYMYFLPLTGSGAMQDTESTGSQTQHFFLSFLFVFFSFPSLSFSFSVQPK